MVGGNTLDGWSGELADPVLTPERGDLAGRGEPHVLGVHVVEELGEHPDPAGVAISSGCSVSTKQSPSAR